MITNSSSNQLRRKAYLAYHQDGIIDILIGSTILGFGLWILSDIVIFTFISWLSFSFYISLKNSITIPRFGYVRFHESKRQTALAIGLGIGLLLLLLIVGILFIIGPDRILLTPITFLRKFHVYVMSGIGAVVMAIFGLWSGIRRLTSYALVMIAALVLSIQLEIIGGITLSVMGGLILLIGLALLVRFIRRNPLQRGEANNVT
jgi:hypothetical protein